MARQLELKSVPLDVEGLPPDFDYAATMLLILRMPSQQGGVTLDEIIETMPVVDAIEAADRSRSATVTLTDRQWEILRDKLALFRFSLVHRVIAEFGAHIRNAPEIGMTGEEPRAVPRRVS